MAIVETIEKMFKNLQKMIGADLYDYFSYR